MHLILVSFPRPLHGSVFCYLYFHLYLPYLCLSVCSPAATPPCSPPSVWTVFLLLLLSTTAIKTRALPHSFPSALETPNLHLSAHPLTYPLLHSTLHHVCSFPITFPLLPILRLSHLLFKTPVTIIALSLSTTPHWILNLKLIPACPFSLKLTSVLHPTLIQIACAMAAAHTRWIPLPTAICPVHLSQSQTTPIPAWQIFVPTLSQTASPSQILILKPCSWSAFTLAARLILLPVHHYNLTLTPRPTTLLCSHVGGPQWSLPPPTLFHTQSTDPLPVLCPSMTLTQPVKYQTSQQLPRHLFPSPALKDPRPDPWRQVVYCWAAQKLCSKTNLCVCLKNVATLLFVEPLINIQMRFKRKNPDSKTESPLH